MTTAKEQPPDNARELTELIESLVEAAVHGAHNPAHSHAALKAALRCFELALPAEAAHEITAWTDGLLSDMPTDVLREIGRKAIQRTPTAAVLPPEILPTIVESATVMLDTIPEDKRTPRYALAAVHMAECLVLATQKSESEKDALFLDLTAIKRMFARINFEVLDARGLSKGGDA